MTTKSKKPSLLIGDELQDTYYEEHQILETTVFNEESPVLQKSTFDTMLDQHIKFFSSRSNKKDSIISNSKPKFEIIIKEEPNNL